MPIRAFVLVTTKPGTSEEVVRARRVRGVKLANSVFGRFDAVIMVEAKDLEELRRIVYEMIEQLPNVVHTETLISLFYPPEPP
ncbi:MAG: Lrp/AsnC family transcriptional regulator [Candidatus Hecatellales archaeon]|nr:MAG: Lrp/AsnC family transcriptional regulator [Candidatus Hecatellales archaeon]